MRSGGDHDRVGDVGDECGENGQQRAFGDGRARVLRTAHGAPSQAASASGVSGT